MCKILSYKLIFQPMISRYVVIIFFLLITFITSVHADVKLPAVIADNMVIQQKTAVSIWGWAEPGERVTIKGSWQGLEKSIVTDEKGHWLVKLKSPKAGGPYSISIQGRNKIVLKNVLCGEVWFVSGHSKMAFELIYADVEF
jgi:sialate O-acetylesterase